MSQEPKKKNTEKRVPKNTPKLKVELSEEQKEDEWGKSIKNKPKL